MNKVNLALVLMIVLSLLPASQLTAVARPQAPIRGGGVTYLPFVINKAPVPVDPSTSSIGLIEQAEASGLLDSETALIYKVFATFEDPRLPAQYVGPGVRDDGDLVMDEVAARANTLSEATRQILTPFFIPPTYPGSWYQLSHSAQNTRSPQAGWESVDTLNGKIKIWYLSTTPGSQAKAQGLQAAIDGKIWKKMVDTMGREPHLNVNGQIEVFLWDSYREYSGNVVAFDPTTMGVTISNSCYGTSVIIYLPDHYALGTETQPGLIQYMTHELMHALQHSFAMTDCIGYKWLKEATANWSEDLVYPKANSEWITGDARSFMQNASKRLDNVQNNHHYGAYLLPYYLSHQLDGPQVVRRIWENSEADPNSYTAVQNALPEGMREHFWNSFLISLWNKAPFSNFYQTEDSLTETVKPENSTPIQITSPSGEAIYPIEGDLVTGGARYYHFTFSDSSVHSLTILNGLGYNLTKGGPDYAEGNFTDGDQTYVPQDLSEEEAAGTTLILLMKAAGEDWMPMPWTESRLSRCMDIQKDLEELVVIQSNADWKHPDRVMKAKGLPTTLYANNMPCWKLSGTSRVTIYNAGVTLESSATVTYSYPSGFDEPLLTYPYADNVSVFPTTMLFLREAQVNWTISGTDPAGCVHSGGGSYSVAEDPGHGGDSVFLFNGILSGSPSWRGYQGGGYPNEGEQITYEVTCPDRGTETITEDAPWFLEIPIYDNRENIKVPAGGGAFSGIYRRQEPLGDYEEFEWHLNPEQK